MCFPFQVRARSFEYARVWVCLVCVGGGGKMDTAVGREGGRWKGGGRVEGRGACMQGGMFGEEKRINNL